MLLSPELYKRETSLNIRVQETAIIPSRDNLDVLMRYKRFICNPQGKTV